MGRKYKYTHKRGCLIIGLPPAVDPDLVKLEVPQFDFELDGYGCQGLPWRGWKYYSHLGKTFDPHSSMWGAYYGRNPPNYGGEFVESRDIPPEFWDEEAFRLKLIEQGFKKDRLQRALNSERAEISKEINNEYRKERVKGLKAWMNFLHDLLNIDFVNSIAVLRYYPHHHDTATKLRKKTETLSQRDLTLYQMFTMQAELLYTIRSVG